MHAMVSTHMFPGTLLLLPQTKEPTIQIGGSSEHTMNFFLYYLFYFCLRIAVFRNSSLHDSRMFGLEPSICFLISTFSDSHFEISFISHHSHLVVALTFLSQNSKCLQAHQSWGPQP